MSDTVINATAISKAYPGGTQILTDLNLTVARGESVAIVGASGCGKSTLLHVLAGLIKPEQGKCELVGEDLTTASPKQQGKLRNQSLGFVYQFHHLLAEFTAAENVAMPSLLGNVPRKQALAKAIELLTAVGLVDHANKLPSKLSGGERQRVAITRALANNPECVLADEPTGNLDQSLASSVIDLLLQQCSERGCALILATHDHTAAKRLGRCLQLQNGTLVAT